MLLLLFSYEVPPITGGLSSSKRKRLRRRELADAALVVQKAADDASNTALFDAQIENLWTAKADEPTAAAPAIRPAVQRIEAKAAPAYSYAAPQPAPIDVRAEQMRAKAAEVASAETALLLRRLEEAEQLTLKRRLEAEAQAIEEADMVFVMAMLATIH